MLSLIELYLSKYYKVGLYKYKNVPSHIIISEFYITYIRYNNVWFKVRLIYYLLIDTFNNIDIFLKII